MMRQTSKPYLIFTTARKKENVEKKGRHWSTGLDASTLLIDTFAMRHPESLTRSQLFSPLRSKEPKERMVLNTQQATFGPAYPPQYSAAKYNHVRSEMLNHDNSLRDREARLAARQSKSHISPSTNRKPPATQEFCLQAQRHLAESSRQRVSWTETRSGTLHKTSDLLGKPQYVQ
jgi:hypothetical protein